MQPHLKMILTFNIIRANPVKPAPEANEAQARNALERVQRELRGTLSRLRWCAEVRITASLGAVMHDGKAEVSSAELLNRADAMMYQAKQLGGDRLALLSSSGRAA